MNAMLPRVGALVLAARIDTSGVGVVFARNTAPPESGAWARMRRKSREISYFFDSCEPGLQGAPHCLHSGCSASHYGSLRTLHAHMSPIRFSRTLDRMPLRKSCLSAGEQLSFIWRLACGFQAASGFRCK